MKELNKTNFIEYLVNNITKELYEESCLGEDMRIYTMNVISKVLHNDLMLEVILNEVITKKGKKS